MVVRSSIERAIEGVREAIAGACERAGRTPDEVRLIAVTKGVPAERIRRGYEAGAHELGENYVQELETKRRAVPEATWHFLGRLQSNKVGRILESADVVQTLEPGRPAGRLRERVESGKDPLECLVQVDYTGARVGVAPEEAPAFVEELVATPGLRVGGLMTIPPLEEPARPYFARLRELRDRLHEDFPDLRDLSMGMSADYEEAVEEGATMVRVGTAIFGPRP